MLPYAFICIRHASARTHMPPYASIHIHYAGERQCSTHMFAENSKKQKSVKTAKLELRSAASNRANPTQYTKSAKKW